MKSNFDKLTLRQQRACMMAGYNRLYGDFPTVAQAKQNIVDTPATASMLEITGAVNALKNTFILSCVRENLPATQQEEILT
jgi:hypothetical protein